MNLKHLRWIFVGVLAAFLIVANVTDSTTFGVSSEWSSSTGYHFSGGTSPWALAFSVAVIGLYLLLMNAMPTQPGQPLPGVVRRFVAFWLDFLLAIAAIAPIFGIVPMLAEWRRTRVFEWSFERTTAAPSDGPLIAAGMLLGSVALVFYYALPLVRHKPSPGACILGYQVIPENRETLPLRTALLRTLLGFIAVSGACLAPFVARDRKNGKFWLDKVFATRAVTLT